MTVARVPVPPTLLKFRVRVKAKVLAAATAIVRVVAQTVRLPALSRKLKVAPLATKARLPALVPRHAVSMGALSKRS